MLSDVAIRNNAAWCDAMCRSHGIPTVEDRSVWRALRRAPPFYPDAVTLARQVEPAVLLEGVDPGPGCSVKDSYADVDLAGWGFRLLIDGRWIGREPLAPGDVRPWRPIDPAALPDWVEAWRGGAPHVDVFRPALLDTSGTALVADLDDGRIVAGAALHRSHGVVGVTNLFDSRRRSPSWAPCLAAAAALAPGERVVAYVPADHVRACTGEGFVELGRLRVWLAEHGVTPPGPAVRRAARGRTG